MIELHHGDCLAVLPTLDVGRIAAVVTDPPYGMDLAKRSGVGRSKCAVALDRYEIRGDDRPFDPSPWIEFPRVILWGANHYASRLPDARCWLAWDKREGGTSDDQADCELAWTNLPGPARLFGHRWRGMVKASERRGRRLHPTQKPVALMAWCIERLRLPPGSVILDPYLGSGTTGVAAARLGFDFIGIESDPVHFATARRRLEGPPMPLFDPPPARPRDSPTPLFAGVPDP